MNQSLTDIINNEDPEWIKSVMQSNDLVELNKRLRSPLSLNRKAIIRARIENLTHLIS